MTVHTVKSGEHLPAIAERFGFSTHTPIWDHPDNAELRAARGTAEILAPGDRLTLPERVVKSLDAATGQRHVFVVQREPLELRVTLRDLAGNPQGGVQVEVTTGEGAKTVSTGGEGTIVVPIRRSEQNATVAVGEILFDVAIGALDPIDTESGIHARLVNLGYLEAPLPAPTGEVDPEEEAARQRELAAAIEELQCDQGLPQTGALDGATQAKLLELHGC